MSLKRVVISGVLAGLCVCTVTLAQDAQPPQRQDVMSHIPHDALGFVVARSVRSATDAADAFLEETKISEDNDELSEGVLEAISRGLTLGEGFDADGGIAVVLLNPEPLGIDLEQEIGESIAQFVVSSMPGFSEVMETIFGGRVASSQPAMPRVPYAILLPGRDVQSVLPMADIYEDPEGTTLSFADVDEVFHASQLGDYVVVSPLAGALEVISEAHNQPIKLSPDHAELLNASEAAAWVDIEAVRNSLGGLLDKLERMGETPETTTAPTTQAVEFKEALATLSAPSLVGPSPLQMFREVRQATVGIRLAQLGPRVEAVVEYEPEGEYVTSLVTRDSPEQLLDRLPDMPYMMALGLTMPRTDTDKVRNFLEYHIAEIDGLDEDVRTELIDNGSELLGQVRSIQFVWGSAPEEHMGGVFGFAAVVECDDSQQVRELLAGLSAQAGEALAQVAESEQDVPEFEIIHQAGAESIDENPVDILTLAETQPGEFGMGMMMSMLLDSPDVAVRIAAADQTHLVLTAGGEDLMLAEAITAARAAEATIPQRPEVAALLDEMPGEPQAVFLMNVGTYIRLMMRAFGGMGMAPPPIVEDFTDEPVAVMSGVDGNLERYVFHVPTRMVGDFTAFINSMERMYSSPSQSGPPPDAEDF